MAREVSDHRTVEAEQSLLKFQEPKPKFRGQMPEGSIMDYMFVSFQHSYIETLTPAEMVLGL